MAKALLSSTATTRSAAALWLEDAGDCEMASAQQPAKRNNAPGKDFIGPSLNRRKEAVVENGLPPLSGFCRLLLQAALRRTIQRGYPMSPL